MELARDEARSVRLRARRAKREGGMLAGEGDDSDTGDGEETGMAEFYPAKGETKRWYGPLAVGTAIGAALVAIAWKASK